MAFLLDTMALSELTKSHPNMGFMKWLSGAAASETFIASPTIGEIESGITLLANSAKRRRLTAWLDDLLDQFGERILPFDTDAARVWGRSIALARRNGFVLPVVDAQLASIGVVNGLTVVSRNLKHFNARYFDGLETLSPWT